MREDRTGWTGGQWSVVRVVLGLAIAAQHLAVAMAGGQAVSWLAAGTALALAVGWRAEIAGLALFTLTIFFDVSPFPTQLVGAVFAVASGAPYGSVDARGRADPGGGWVLTNLATVLAWAFLVVLAAFAGGVLTFGWPHQESTLHWPGFEITLGLAHLLGAVAAVVIGARLSVWIVVALPRLVSLGLGAMPFLDVPALAGLTLAFRPAWVPAVRTGTPLLLFYDGDCGFCHRTVRFLLSEDRAGVVQFAPLFGPTFEARVAPDARASLPDSLVLLTADGSVLVGSKGAIATARALGGLWRVVAEVLALLPTALLDAAYYQFTRIRRRLFARPEGICPLIPPSLRGRFPDLAAQRSQVGPDGGL